MKNNAFIKEGNINFKLRFNTTHGDTNLFWRIIIEDIQYLATSIDCRVPTVSDESFDKTANCIKFNIAGKCNKISIDKNGKAVLL